MKKILFQILIVSVFVINANAQSKLDDFGRIVLNTYLSEKLSIPTESRQLLETKLSQMASNYGMAGSDVNPRFIITANLNVNSKKIIAGPPQMVSQKVDITFFIGDTYTNSVFANIILTLSGVGSNENTAYIDALNSINPKNKTIEAFMNEGKSKIIDYYNSQCEINIKESVALVSQQKFDEAIFRLSLVPEVCQDCYFKCQETIRPIFQQKIDYEGDILLNKAKAVWMSEQTEHSAGKAFEILCTINPNSKCQPYVSQLYKSIEEKLISEKKKQWELSIKLYQDNLELEKLYIKTYHSIALEYAKNQPKTISNTIILW